VSVQYSHILIHEPIVYNGTYLLTEKKQKKVAKGGLRPSFSRKPTACGHPYAYPEDGRRYKSDGRLRREDGNP